MARRPRDQSSVFPALSSFPPPSVMLESSENGCVDFGTVSYKEKPWWFSDSSRYVWACHRSWLVKFKNYTPRVLDLRSAVDDAGFVDVKDRMPRSVTCCPPLQQACKPLLQIIWLQMFQS